MGKLESARSQARRQPLVVLSLLLNVLLMGGSMFLWSGGGLLLGAPQAPSAHGRLAGAPGFQACERAGLNETLLDEWGCKLFERVCFDQEHVLLHDGRKTPDSPTFTPDSLFDPHPVPPYVLPGYDEPLGTPHYAPKCWDIDIRGPTPLDPPDVWQPAEFTDCTVPLVWWLTYFSVFGDLFIGGALALDAMLGEGAIDRNVTLAPVQPLAALSSREHIRTGQPRCFERAIMCNLVGLYNPRARRRWTQLRPKTTGRREGEGAVFRVAFMPRSRLRQIVNLKDAVEECENWVPPADTRFKRVECVLLPDGSPDTFVELLAAVQHVHALVNTHGSGNNFAFFMPAGTALIEILPWDFHGKGCTWADQYFSDWFQLDHSVHSGYFRLVADKDHVFPGPYEREQRGSSIAYGRDQDVALDFPTLARVLEKVARGQLETTDANHHERTFFMTRRDICPGAEEAAKREEEERKQKEAEQQLAELAARYETKAPAGNEAGEAAGKEAEAAAGIKAEAAAGKGAEEAAGKEAEATAQEGQAADVQAVDAAGSDGKAADAAAGDEQADNAATAEAAQQAQAEAEAGQQGQGRKATAAKGAQR